MNESIKLVPSMSEVPWWQRHTHNGQVSQSFREQKGIARAYGSPLRQALQLDAADSALQLGEAEVRTEAFV